MICSVHTMSVSGIQGSLVRVECYLTNGLPNFEIVGLPDAAVKEARERVRAAAKTSGLAFPTSRITVNLNDESLKFEPINRIVFGVDTQNFVRQLERSCKVSYEPCKDENGQECQHVDMYLQGEVKHMWIQKPSSNMVTGTIQNFIDTYVQEFSGKVDYVHGNSIVQQLSSLKDNVGFIFPAMGKEVLFETILVDDILPRKTFSMGKAEDKRFYLECRKIIK